MTLWFTPTEKISKGYEEDTKEEEKETNNQLTFPSAYSRDLSKDDRKEKDR